MRCREDGGFGSTRDGKASISGPQVHTLRQRAPPRGNRLAGHAASLAALTPVVTEDELGKGYVEKKMGISTRGSGRNGIEARVKKENQRDRGWSWVSWWQ
jgi:hypothetical protein